MRLGGQSYADRQNWYVQRHTGPVGQVGLERDGNLMNNLKKRSVDDTEALPKYPYRDDAVLLWKAINDYVTIVVNHVYGECEDLNLKLLLVGLFFSSSDPRRQSLSKC